MFPEAKLAARISVVILAIGAAIVLLFGESGCALAKPGGGCKGDAASCTDKNNALSCQDGKYVAFACTGPLGCAEVDGGAVLCDQSAGAAASSPCAPLYNGLAQCSADQSAVLVCQGGLWQPVVCPGSMTCHRDATSVWCAP
jgi:hypothetical protein